MKSKIFIQISVIFGCMLLSACSSSSSASKAQSNSSLPEWVEYPGSEFSEVKYLLAVGGGNTYEEARRNALTNLSAIFRADIKGTQELISEFNVTSTANNELYSSGTSTLLNNVKIGTKQELMNTEILKSEVGSNGTYYALAGMDRMETSNIYTQEIENNQSKISRLIERSEDSDEIIPNLATLKQALLLAKINENLTKQLNIINSGMADINAASETVTNTQELFDATKRQALVFLSPNGDNQTVNSAVTEVLQKEGFSISEDESKSIMKVNVDFKTQDADLGRDDAEFVNWELIIETIDLQSNRSFKTFSTSGRDGALSKQDALKRADFSAKKTIDKDFKKFLQQQLLSQN